MQFTLSSVLAASLVALSAAAAVPAAPAISTPLPAKFTLTMTPNVANTGTALDKFPPVVSVDQGADTSKSTQPTSSVPHTLTNLFTAQMGLGGLDHPGLPQIKFTGPPTPPPLVTASPLTHYPRLPLWYRRRRNPRAVGKPPDDDRAVG